MARILFVWELGKGYGHLVPYLDLVKALRREGHHVAFAARDVGHAHQVFSPLDVEVMQAPIMMHNVTDPYKLQYNMAHLLHNTGLGEPESVLGLAEAWRRLYRTSEPDLVIFDHSPTAMFAARGFAWKRIVSGSGFLIPPAGKPMPMMRYWQKYDPERLYAEEDRLLAGLNTVLERLGETPLESVSDIYRADAEFLLGFEEMDHYPKRGGGTYLGMFTATEHGEKPVWPEKFKRRIFAYLHPYKNLSVLLNILSRAKISSLIYAPGVPDAVKKKYSRDHLVFTPRPVEINQAAAGCQVAITSGTFGTTAALLLAGRQVLCIPSNLERIMVARRVMQMKAGVGVSQSDTGKLKPALRALFENKSFAEAADGFSRKYAGLDQAWQTRQMMDTVSRLLGKARGR